MKGTGLKENQAGAELLRQKPRCMGYAVAADEDFRVRAMHDGPVIIAENS